MGVQLPCAVLVWSAPSLSPAVEMTSFSLRESKLKKTTARVIMNNIPCF